MQTTIITGHVGRVSYTEKTTETQSFQVLTFSLASNARTKKGNITNWFTCKLWGPLSKSLAPHLMKGQAVSVEGRVEARPYTAKDGSPKADLVLHVNRLEFIGPKPQNAPETVEGEPSPDVALEEETLIQEQE